MQQRNNNTTTIFMLLSSTAKPCARVHSGHLSDSRLRCKNLATLPTCIRSPLAGSSWAVERACAVCCLLT